MKTLFDDARLQMTDAIRLAVETLAEYAGRYRHWAVAYSGGKDSTATLTTVLWAIGQRQVPVPESLTVLYADTRMELPPLQFAAMDLLAQVRQRGYQTRVVLPELDDRFFVYMFGRGVPPPSNTFRWCTDQLKIEPISRAVRSLKANSRVLMLTGVRLGESAARDQSIVTSCSRDGAECGQGRMHLSLVGDKTNNINRYFVPGTPASPCDTLAPLLHWRTCHVWDWLTDATQDIPDHGFCDLTQRVAEVYGGTGDHERLVEESARTGCVGCNLASQDFSLQRILRQPKWQYLAPLQRLKPLYAELKKPEHRLRKPGGERRADGSLCSNQNRLGPLTMEARHWGLAQILDIQERINSAARLLGRPEYSLINDEEHARILELIEADTWPRRWSGQEPVGSELLPETNQDGSVQHWLFGG